MRIVNFILLLIVISVFFYQWEDAQPDFSGARWSCTELSKNFTSEPYKQYKEIQERDVLQFASSSNLSIYQSGYLLHKEGGREKYEVIFEIDYTVNENVLSLNYKKVNWHDKPLSSPTFIKDTESYEGYKTDLNFIIDNNRLYFHNRKANEDANFVCFAT